MYSGYTGKFIVFLITSYAVKIKIMCTLCRESDFKNVTSIQIGLPERSFVRDQDSLNSLFRANHAIDVLNLTQIPTNRFF